VTSLAAWVAVDQRGPSSAYIATDSRISWRDERGLVIRKMDNSRKTSASPYSPQIFGFVGDVIFPALQLDTVSGLLERAASALSLEHNFERFHELVDVAWRDVPKEERRDSWLVHFVRIGEGMESVFGLQVLHQAAGNSVWDSRVYNMPERSAVLDLLGSGSRDVREAYGRWLSHSIPTAGQRVDHRGHTSRAVFSAFCESVHEGPDPATGGAPQLVGLYRKGDGRRFGVHWRGVPFVAGVRADGLDLQNIEWRNPYFERVDAQGKLVSSAQRHARSPVRDSPRAELL
jgi:hypothetical protein